MTTTPYAAIAAIVGADNYLDDPTDCWPYGYDNSKRHQLPDAVAFPTSHDQILKIIQHCNQHRIPVVPRGRGTGTTGATVPTRAGLVLSFERMNRIIEVDPKNRLIIVEPGVTNKEVQDAAGEHGFFWPPDPTSAAFCSVGGNLAYNSAGPKAVKYGTPRENVLGLHAITGDGKSIRTGVYTTKGVVGYDLTRLIIGSEGTLAVISQATLKLTPLAETKRTLQAYYRDIKSATQAVSAIMAQPVIPCALEFMDGTAIKLIRDYPDCHPPEHASAMLMIEVDGPLFGIEAMTDAISHAASTAGLLELNIANTTEQVDNLWATRKALSPALRKIAPQKINEDVVVPVSRIPELIEGLDILSQQYGIQIVNFGHAGNGNIHVNMLVNPEDPLQNNNIDACLSDIFKLVLELKGTLSGEHGIGLVKREHIGLEIEPDTLDLMKRIKAQFDPLGILNPDKIFPIGSNP